MIFLTSVNIRTDVYLVWIKNKNRAQPLFCPSPQIFPVLNQLFVPPNLLTPKSDKITQSLNIQTKHFKLIHPPPLSRFLESKNPNRSYASPNRSVESLIEASGALKALIQASQALIEGVEGLIEGLETQFSKSKRLILNLLQLLQFSPQVID